MIKCLFYITILLLSFPKHFVGQQKISYGKIEIVIQPMLEDHPFYFDTLYKSPGQENFSLKTLKFFISDLALSTSLSKEFKGKQNNNGVYLIDLDNSNSESLNMFSFEIETGKYSDLRFNIGVPRQLNHSDPTMAPAPLNIGKGDMFWTWKSGYIFFLVEGWCTDLEKNLHLAIGGDQNVMPVTLGNLFNVSPLIKIEEGKTTRITLKLDLANILINTDGKPYLFNNDEAVQVHGGIFAEELRNNIIKSFEFISAEIKK